MARKLWWKRHLDCFVLITLGPVALVLMGFVAGSVLWKLGRPVLFWQERTGLGGRPFRLAKFRTMSEGPGSLGGMNDKDRTSAFGRWLRALGLDELPQLWNVFRGDMSLVGPRPLLVEYLLLYTVEQARRHTVPPGLTGWAQVNGRNSQSWEERFDLDCWYLENASLWLDIRILTMTALLIVSRKRMWQCEQASMDRFHGSAQPALTRAGDDR